MDFLHCVLWAFLMLAMLLGYIESRMKDKYRKLWQEAIVNGETCDGCHERIRPEVQRLCGNCALKFVTSGPPLEEDEEED